MKRQAKLIGITLPLCLLGTGAITYSIIYDRKNSGHFSEEKEKVFHADFQHKDETIELQNIESSWKEQLDDISKGGIEEVLAAQRKWISQKIVELPPAAVPEFISFLRVEVGDAVFFAVLPLCVQKAAQDIQVLESWVKTLSPIAEDRHILKAIGVAVAYAEPKATSELVSSWNLDDKRLNFVLEGVCSGISAYDPLRAFKILQAFDKSGSSSTAWINVARSGAKAGLSATLIDQILTQESGENSRAATPYGTMAKVIVETLADDDIHASVAILEKESAKNSGYYPQMVDSLIKQWFRVNPKEASQWLNALPDGAGKNMGASTLAKCLSVTSPSDAIEWYEIIRDPELKEATASYIYERWKALDADGAETWKKSIN